MRYVPLTFLLSALLLAGCGGGSGDQGKAPETTKAGKAQPAAADTTQAARAPAKARRMITASELAAHVKTLASDEFGGRGPSTPDEDKTVNYISNQFEQAGLEPANDGSWFQEVPLVSITLKPGAQLTIDGMDQPMVLDQAKNTEMWTKRVTDHVSLDKSDMVFVGYGIVAPEYDWNDYAGVDVKGKTVVILVNDPGYATKDPDLFNGNAMTYYGRWTYKYEEAARQGAAAAIIVHEEAPAGYPWEVVTGSWTGPQFELEQDNDHMDRVKVEGWITHDVADKIFKSVGSSYEEAKASAAKRDFKVMDMGNLTASTSLDNAIKHTKSRNVAGMVKGSEWPDETVVYTAHWDHLGRHPDKEGDQIYNGAVDNATGVAGLIELAEDFAMRKQPPRRTVLFLAVTSEEQGLLGSQYYTEHPMFPLAKTAANINMDAMMPFGKTHDIVLVGTGMNELGSYLRKAADKEGRKVVPEPTPEKGFYFRSDHFNFAKHGVPALYTDSGIDLLEGGKGRGSELAKDYTANRYHKPADEYDSSWDMTGIVQDLQLLYKVGSKVADSHVWPKWTRDNAFKQTRDESASVRASGAN